MDKMREEFEAWWNSEGQKITTGTKGDALITWQAARAQHVAAIDTSPERVEKAGWNRQVDPVAWLDVEMGAAYTAEELADGGDFIPLYTAPPAHVLDGWQLVEQLADALRNVEEEMRLLSWQKSIELRRPAGSFGIAVKNDQLALEWQKVDAQLQDLYAKRRAALDAAPQPKVGE